MTAADSSSRNDSLHGSPTGAVRITLRLEGLVLVAVATALYFHLGYAGAQFGVWFLAPDLALLAYLAGTRTGTLAYNATHSTIGPLALGAIAVFAAPATLPFALIWLAHIGLDRAFGYGLKYADGFAFTHLGRVGRAAASLMPAAANGGSRIPAAANGSLMPAAANGSRLDAGR